MKSSTTVANRRIFVDTSAYFALADAGDANHSQAKTIAAQLTQDGSRLFTTNLILAETHALFLTRLGRVVALSFLRELDRSATTVTRATVADEHRARDIIEKYVDKNFSLCDAISFAVMERLSISLAFSFDRHFAQYRFSVITPR